MKLFRWFWWKLSHRHAWMITFSNIGAGRPRRNARVDRECSLCGRYEVYTYSFRHIVHKGAPKP